MKYWPRRINVWQAVAANEQAVYASLHALLIVSDTARRLGAAAEHLMPSLLWREIRGIGNILRQEYDGVHPNVVWRIIVSRLLKNPLTPMDSV